MKPALFDYRRPTTVAEALTDLNSVAGARILAGGQSLVPLLSMRLARPPLLVDINRVTGLDELTVSDGRVHIGATVRQAAVLASPLAAQHLPLAVAALARVSHPQVRSRGTVVGNMCHHDPASEMPAVALALHAEFTVIDRDGTTVTVPAADFFLDQFEVAVPVGGLVTRVSFPSAPPGSGAGFFEVARKARDYALLAAAAQLTVVDGVVSSAAVAVTGLGHRPQRMTATEQALVGQRPTQAVLQDAARAATGEALAHVNRRSSAHYRTRVLPVAVHRALRAAIAHLEAAR